MRQRRIVFQSCALLLLVMSQLRAQSSQPLKWGKVTPEELRMKACPYDSSAPAVVLNDYGWIEFGNGIEPYVAYPLDYAERITFHLKMYTESNGVPADIQNHSRFLAHTKQAGKVLEAVLTGKEAPAEKLRKIYNHVTKSFTWSGTYGIVAGQPFNALTDTRTGNSAELNLYLALLLREGCRSNAQIIPV